MKHNNKHDRLLWFHVWILAAVMLTPQLTWGAQDDRWEAQINRGQMTVVRAGSELVFSQRDGVTEVLRHDVLRVGADSFVTLVTSDKAIITLGSHAVMEVRSWQSSRKSGVLRMLFGRMRAKLVRLGASERFDIKSATATIGVKGSEFKTFVSPGGTTVNICVVHECLLTDNLGNDLFIPAGYTAVSLDRGTGKVIETPVELTVGDDVSSENERSIPVVEESLDVPDANEDEGTAIFEEVLLDEQLVPSTELASAETDHPELGDLDSTAFSPEKTPGADEFSAESPVDLDDAIQSVRKEYVEVKVIFEK